MKSLARRWASLSRVLSQGARGTKSAFGGGFLFARKEEQT
jgi:hypothetical protein